MIIKYLTDTVCIENSKMKDANYLITETRVKKTSTIITSMII